MEITLHYVGDYLPKAWPFMPIFIVEIDSTNLKKSFGN
jgi:hypothetical protein